MVVQLSLCFVGKLEDMFFVLRHGSILQNIMTAHKFYTMKKISTIMGNMFSGNCEKVSFKSICADTEANYRLAILDTAG